MEYEESYQGRRVVVKTMQTTAGTWTSEAEVLGDGQAVSIAGENDTYSSEDEARRSALSAAAATIDRARASRGKP